MATLTDHCCHLIVKTKYSAIKEYVQNMDISPRKTKQYSSTSDSEDASEVEVEFDEVREHEEHMKCHMSYGDVGWSAFGKTGLYLVNFFIAVTQFGFCVGYFIFIGNTLHRLFPVEPCDNVIWSGNLTSHSYPLCHGAKVINPPVNQSDLFLHHNHIRDLTPNSVFINSSVAVEMATTKNTTLETTTTNTTLETTTLSSTTYNTSGTTSPVTTTAANSSEISSIVEQSTAPSLKLLVASPLPLFIIFAMIRTIRKMSFISVIANLSIFLGCIAVFIFLVIGKLIEYSFDKFKRFSFSRIMLLLCLLFYGS